MYTARKVFVFGVTQYECGKLRPTKTPSTDTFHAVINYIKTCKNEQLIPTFARVNISLKKR